MPSCLHATPLDARGSKRAYFYPKAYITSGVRGVNSVYFACLVTGQNFRNSPAVVFGTHTWPTMDALSVRELRQVSSPYTQTARENVGVR